LSTGQLAVKTDSGNFQDDSNFQFFSQDDFCIDGTEPDEMMSFRINSYLSNIGNEKAVTFSPDTKVKVLSDWNQLALICFPDEVVYDTEEPKILADQLAIAILPWVNI